MHEQGALAWCFGVKGHGRMPLAKLRMAAESKATVIIVQMFLNAMPERIPDMVHAVYSRISIWLMMRHASERQSCRRL